MKSISIFTITLLAIFCFAGPSFAKLPPQARQNLYKAQLLLDEEKYAEAATLIKKYMNSTTEPVDAQIFLVLGGAQLQTGNDKQAYDTFKRGFARHPDNLHLCRNTAVTAYKLERYNEAGMFLEKTYALQKPANPETLFQAGSIYYKGDNFKSSVRVLQKLIAQTKNPDKEWVSLAIHALLENGQPDRAKSLLLKYLERAPDDSAYWKLLAKLHMDKEQLEKTAAALEIAYRLKRPSQQELENLSSIYRYKEAPLLAAATLERAYGTAINSEQALKIATLYASAGRIKKAISCMDRYSQTKSTSLKKGILLFKSRRFNDAREAFKASLGTKNAGEARFYMALCAWELKDWQKAKQELKKITDGNFTKRASGYLEVLLDIETAQIESAE
ncbi:tetratricopeptide repeat protein [Maridesulfovibrio salexigens]|uniref:Tetratricopeptide domain protein n=1 Tax=Maridesulfovibrio salexigens (strain ATCC 14822 / DSM 2638 / NCIMB 8403 / VKM B-1763) TaxID=526222 RepID=C6BVU3_MARSD|nr:tetratricopeptide repeat protein [Maridesulfovibrio salexigens]ACS80146.1 Tetratricopeptide domain protein [Maridesulfovibrio salexigens DSM 2638]